MLQKCIAGVILCMLLPPESIHLLEITPCPALYLPLSSTSLPFLTVYASVFPFSSLVSICLSLSFLPFDLIPPSLIPLSFSFLVIIVSYHTIRISHLTISSSFKRQKRFQTKEGFENTKGNEKAETLVLFFSCLSPSDHTALHTRPSSSRPSAYFTTMHIGFSLPLPLPSYIYMPLTFSFPPFRPHPISSTDPSPHISFTIPSFTLLETRRKKNSGERKS